MRLELTNYETLHGWGVVNNSAAWHAQRNRKPSTAEQAVEEIFLTAYDRRTTPRSRSNSTTSERVSPSWSATTSQRG